MFNIGMLKKVFSPTFQLHDVRQTGEFEATTRWTMVMQPTVNRALGLQRWWDPQLVFTGVSIMGVNPENGPPPSTTTTTDDTCEHYHHSPTAFLDVQGRGAGGNLWLLFLVGLVWHLQDRFGEMHFVVVLH